MADARLENWVIFLNWRGDKICTGTVYDDSKGRFEDGTEIFTSPVQAKTCEIGSGKESITTLNTTYELGKPAELEGEGPELEEGPE